MKTQIFGTFGPACGSKEIIENMIHAGMTGMRLNLSHTTLPESADYIKNYQKATTIPKQASLLLQPFLTILTVPKKTVMQLFT